MTAQHCVECKGNYSAASNNRKLVRWQYMGGLLHLLQRGAHRGPFCCTKSNNPPINGQCTCQVLGSQVSVILATYVTAFLRH